MESVNIPVNQNDQTLQQPNNNISTVVESSSKKSHFIYLAVFIGIVLLILILTLNYFNILSLSIMLPNQLGWLPHKQPKQETSVTISPTASVTQQAKQARPPKIATLESV